MAKAMTKADSEALMERMNAAREAAEEIKATKSRLAGELSTHEKRMKELEDECKKKFGVAISALPAKVASLNKEAEKLVEEAEALLTVTEG
jgi:DNA repair ATPase RecN